MGHTGRRRSGSDRRNRPAGAASGRTAGPLRGPDVLAVRVHDLLRLARACLFHKL
jgi:hypothetical protein